MILSAVVAMTAVKATRIRFPFNFPQPQGFRDNEFGIRIRMLRLMDATETPIYYCNGGVAFHPLRAAFFISFVRKQSETGGHKCRSLVQSSFRFARGFLSASLCIPRSRRRD